MSREIQLHIDNVEELDVPYSKLIDAVGYLSTWGLSYPFVDIYREGKTDLIAHYSKENGDHGYTIGAIWNGASYGFHS